MKQSTQGAPASMPQNGYLHRRYDVCLESAEISPMLELHDLKNRDDTKSEHMNHTTDESRLIWLTLNIANTKLTKAAKKGAESREWQLSLWMTSHLFRPHAKRAPEIVNARQWLAPAATRTMGRPGMQDIKWGSLWLVLVARPSCPKLSLPQVYICPTKKSIRNSAVYGSSHTQK
jgi:hypothetical protein